MSAFDFSAPVGSLSPVDSEVLADLFALSDEELRNSLETLQEDLAAVTAWLTSPPEDATDDDRKDKAAVWDEVRQWIAAVEAELTKIAEGGGRRRSRVAILLALKKVEKAFEELEHERSKPDLSHSDMAGYDAWENELLAKEDELEAELKELGEA